MKSTYGSVVGKVLVFAAGILMTLAMSGCGDPTATDMAAQHRRLGNECQQDLRYGLSGFAPAAQTRAFRPAQ